MTAREALPRITVIADAAPETHTLLSRSAVVKHYKKGQHIFRERDKVDNLCAVVQGTVALYKLSTSGEKRGVFIFGAGSLLNEDNLDGKPASINAEALRDCDVLHIPLAAFERACAADSELSRALVHSMAMKVRRLYHLMKNTSNNLRGDRRIAAKLWKLSRDHGVKTAEGTEIDFDLTITMLAEFLGSQRETVSRQVKTLCDEGLVVVRNARFVIPSREKLLGYFEEE